MNKNLIIKKKADITATLSALPLGEPVIFDCNELGSRPEFLRTLASRIQGHTFSLSVKGLPMGQISITRLS